MSGVVGLWIADLVRHGLAKPSFIPSRAQRELREIVRYRNEIVNERARELNRIQAVLEGANIKLGSVVTDISGATGMAILHALVDGKTNPEYLSTYGKGQRITAGTKRQHRHSPNADVEIAA